jgi:hypothetical protein
MPPKKTRKPKQKQKQKQIVKQNVKVNVQSSGGSGGSAPTPMYQPYQASENVNTLNVLGQIAHLLKTPKPVEKIFSSAPTNDSSTLDAVFNAPINTNKPVQLGLDSEKSQKIKKERIMISENEGSPTTSESFPSRSRRKDIGKPRGSYKEKAIAEGRNIQNIFALGGSEMGPSSLPEEAMNSGKEEQPVLSGFQKESYSL